eukprot:3459404-Amphidinium_carterae.2
MLHLSIDGSDAHAVSAWELCHVMLDRLSSALLHMSISMSIGNHLSRIPPAETSDPGRLDVFRQRCKYAK